MKLKNIKELRLRANYHARAGHILQGTYGKGKVNGHADFRGCAIGCLTTPHRKRDLISFLRQQIASGRRHWIDFGSGRTKRRLLRDEFGIDVGLARVAEACFEGQKTHGGAIEFVPAFAAALPDGVDIQDRHVLAFLPREGFHGKRIPNNFIDIRSWMKGLDRGTAPAGGVDGFTERFLAWLASRGTPVAS